MADETTGQPGSERERALAVEAILTKAPEMGVARALEAFGAPLTPTEARLIESLSEEEVTQLGTLRTKLGPLGVAQSMLKNNNNNNNNGGGGGDGDDED